MKQLTEAEAIAFHDARRWVTMSLRERAEFQLRQDRLCMPFGVFHEAVEKTLGRPVFTHEFGLNRCGLIAELAGLAPAPSLEEVIEQIPEEKRVVVVLEDDTKESV